MKGCCLPKEMQGRSVQLQMSYIYGSDCSNAAEYQVRRHFSPVLGRKVKCEQLPYSVTLGTTSRGTELSISIP